MEIVFFIFVVLSVVFTGGYISSLKRDLTDLKNKPLPEPQQVTINLKPLEDKINEMPTKVLQSIVGSTNTHKGALGELIGYIQLRASYDRIVPLGNIVDFMCIKFPTEEEEGHIDFIDIKTGKFSRLSKDQRALQKLIDEKKINFVKLKVDSGDTKSETD